MAALAAPLRSHPRPLRRNPLRSRWLHGAPGSRARHRGRLRPPPRRGPRSADPRRTRLPRPGRCRRTAHDALGRRPQLRRPPTHRSGPRTPALDATCRRGRPPRAARHPAPPHRFSRVQQPALRRHLRPRHPRRAPSRRPRTHRPRAARRRRPPGGADLPRRVRHRRPPTSQRHDGTRSGRDARARLPRPRPEDGLPQPQRVVPRGPPRFPGPRGGTRRAARSGV